MAWDAEKAAAEASRLRTPFSFASTVPKRLPIDCLSRNTTRFVRRPALAWDAEKAAAEASRLRTPLSFARAASQTTFGRRVGEPGAHVL